MDSVAAHLQVLNLKADLLCYAEIELDSDAPIQLGKTPWRHLRVSNIAGGRFEGPKMRGEILRSGADWAEQGFDAGGQATSMLDVRSLWRSDTGALVHVIYGGRVVVPASIFETFRDLSRVESLSATDYYFRTLPSFQTSDERLAWLNNIVAVGLGRRTKRGVQYKIYEIL
jgi:Protein of unknown function (DUF3237)